jgi:uncharacterized protein Yka (UPF0111/DUF47 family)
MPGDPESQRVAAVLETLADLVEDFVAAAQLLHAAFADPSQITAHAEYIDSLERASDATIREMLSRAEHSGDDHPFSGTRLLILSQHLDAAMDALEEISDLMRIYQRFDIIPTEQSVKLASYLRRISAELSCCIEGMKKGEDISGHVRAAAAIENEADAAYRAALTTLLVLGADPVQAMRWKDIYDRLEEAVDRCEDVAQFLGGIISS